MTTSVVSNASVYTDFQGLDQLKASARQSSPDALRKAAKQFEALFLQMMLKSMREASLGEGIFDSEQSKLYLDMFDKQVALELADSRSVGLADMLVRQLGGDDQMAARAGSSNTGSTDDLNFLALRNKAATAISAYRDNVPEAPWPPNSPEAFVSKLWPYATSAANELGAEPEALIAQAVLETGWGEHMMRHQDGRNAYNFFGIKAGVGWGGEVVTKTTAEFVNGKETAVEADFRAYPSVRAAFEDYVDFIRSNPRYRALLETSNAHDYAQHLQQAGYATDPNYASKISHLMGSEVFDNALGPLKN